MPILDSHPKPDTKSAEVPNLQYVVQGVRDSQAWDFSTKEGLCSYSNACVVALHGVDANFGHLTKSEGQNHCNDPLGRYCATDVALYLPTGQIIDFIMSAGYGTPPPGNEVTWGVGPMYEYPASSWFEPVSESGNGEPPVDDQQAQIDHIEHMCEEMKLYLSNMNEQLNLMAGVVNNLYATQALPLEGTVPLPGKTLTLTIKR